MYSREDYLDPDAVEKLNREKLAAVSSAQAALDNRGAPKLVGSDAVVGAPPHRPTIVCLCGSTRFSAAFREANLRETIAGRIVLSIGCDTKSDSDLLALGELTAEAKARLDELHKRKIDLADEILVLNVGGYVGDSTRSEIDYARKLGKRIRWLESEASPAVATASPNEKAQP